MTSENQMDIESKIMPSKLKARYVGLGKWDVYHVDVCGRCTYQWTLDESALVGLFRPQLSWERRRQQKGYGHDNA